MYCVCYTLGLVLSGRVVAMVACGHLHTVVLTRDGAVLSFGGNEWGKLGRETHEDSDAVPGEVRHTALREEEKVVEVTAMGR